MRSLPVRPVFTATEAVATGWTMSALRHATQTGQLTRVRRGVYSRGPKDARAQALAAALTVRGSVISHRSAILLHGLPLIGRQPVLPELTVRPAAGAGHAGVHLHRASLRRRDVTAIDDIEVTAVARTLIDVARHRPTACAVAAIDAARHSGAVCAEDLDDVVRVCWNWPGIRRAQRAVATSVTEAESPLESISRLTLTWLNVPAPALQTQIRDVSGRFLGRVDFYWDEFGVVGEADGRGKYDDRSVLMAEKQREERLADTGLVVVRWGWDDATRRPRQLRARLDAAFERGRRRDRSGFPRQWTLWRQPDVAS